MKVNKTTVTVDRLHVYAKHGVGTQERIVGNDFEVSVSLVYDAEKAMTEDDVRYALSYADVVEVIKDEMTVPADLLEHVAWRIARTICKRFDEVKSGTVTITKLCPPLGVQLAGASFTLSFTA